jgi:hypothetical protein
MLQNHDTTILQSIHNHSLTVIFSVSLSNLADFFKVTTNFGLIPFLSSLLTLSDRIVWTSPN